MRSWRSRRRGPEQLSLWPEPPASGPSPVQRRTYYACACGTYLERVAQLDQVDRWRCEECGLIITCSLPRLAIYDQAWQMLRAGVWPTVRGLAETIGVSKPRVHEHLVKLQNEGLLPPDRLTYVYHTGLRTGWAFCAQDAVDEYEAALRAPYGIGRTA